MPKAKQPNLHSAPAVRDGLVNVVSGLGTAKAKRSHNFFSYATLQDWQQMDAAYQTNWLARAIVDIPAEDMCREWRIIKSKDADAIRIEEDRLMLPMCVQEATTWGNLYGGGGILMLTGQDLQKPLNVNRIRKGSLERLVVFDRYDMSAMTLNTWNVLAPNYLAPEFYTITGGGQQIHWSHFARFNGTRLPRRQMLQTQGWGDSELRKCLDDIMDMVASKDGIAELMQEANVDIITREGLSDELATDQDEAITRRYALFSQMKSVVQMALLDKDETYDRKTLDLGGVAPVIELFMTWISGAAQIPLTRLFGTSAKGLNATGEGDLKNYFNSIRSKQLTRLDPGMRYLDEVLVRSALGYWPDDYNYVWAPLAQPDELQLAQAAKTRADTDMLYLGEGIIRPSQIQRNLQSSEQYQFDDEDIEAQEVAETDVIVRPGDNEEPEVEQTVQTDSFWLKYTDLTVKDGLSHEQAMDKLAP
jgi:phage-related protein (TIGR01555 family)